MAKNNKIKLRYLSIDILYNSANPVHIFLNFCIQIDDYHSNHTCNLYGNRFIIEEVIGKIPSTISFGKIVLKVINFAQIKNDISCSHLNNNVTKYYASLSHIKGDIHVGMCGTTCSVT